jgi:hypothetical protein
MMAKELLVGGLFAAMAAFGVGDSCAGELTVEGNLTVKTNLTVQGQLTSATLSLTNLAISGQATVQKAEIRELVPQGDLSMGPYTNRAVP